MISRRNRKRKLGDIDFENILFDSKNTSGMNSQQMEGVLERPISRYAMFGVSIFFVLLLIFFMGRIFMIQVVNGEQYFDRSTKNALRYQVNFKNRGVIYDRNGQELAWNEAADEESGQEFALRRYIENPGFSHLLGFVSYPQKDARGNYFQTEYEGVSGVEYFYDDMLDAQPSLGIREVNARGEVISENTTIAGYDGQNINLTIDSRLQAKGQEILANYISSEGFDGGSLIIMDVRNGEIITMTNAPEYDSNILSDGEDRETIAAYNVDPKKPFLNRAVGGSFAPGSIVKPFIATGILDKNLVDPNKKISTNGGVLAIENQYFPGQFTYFRDSRDNGSVNMYDAIARSSNIYFFTYGAGYGSNPGLGISGINDYLRRYGFGSQTGIVEFNDLNGVVPNPEWKEETFGEQWLLGDTFYTAIGQYGFLVTPMQAAVAVSAVANGGDVLVPKLIIDEDGVQPEIRNKLGVSEYAIETVHQAMRETVLRGTTQSLNLPFVEVAAKSGTAERGTGRETVNVWAIGFWPLDDPQYAFAVMAENGPRVQQLGVSRVMTQLLQWMNAEEITEYFQ